LRNRTLLKARIFYRKYHKRLIPVFAVVILIGVLLFLGLDKKVIAVIVVLFTLVSQAFIGLLQIISLVPVIGPLIAKVLALPIYWILNSLGYFLSIVAIKKGHHKSVVQYRVLTIAFLIGVLFGFVLGQLV